MGYSNDELCRSAGIQDPRMVYDERENPLKFGMR